MPTWLYLLIIGLVFFLMMRGGCGSHVMDHRHGQHGSSHQDNDERSLINPPNPRPIPSAG